MDIKTLEYMEERAGKARAIVNRINKLNEVLVKVKGRSFKCLVLKVDSGAVSCTDWGSKKVKNDYSAEVEAQMLNAFIDVTNAEIASLELELADI
ncbi:hypothetical protein [Cytobacillus oceanisediminis]|uniref:hypothetical protein n=1 Tax=Cytobacillus oceanisediminis TaxID=665099 RepID=UPI002079E184|nr:hypothetical protein [Cytobacillus oceanisediminis]USK46315.1 hypothetical protein LIT27_10850 [Cytobacillus oceanisediminis]